MKEIAQLRSKEALSTRELPNYDEEKRKPKTGLALQQPELNASHRIF